MEPHPVIGDAHDPAEFRVLILTCGDLGFEVARRIAERLPAGNILVVRSPYVQRKLSLIGRVRDRYRMEGMGGLLHALGDRLGLRRSEASSSLSFPPPPGISRREVSDFHSQEAIEQMSGFAPDLGVVAGTYILKPEVFRIPRLGSVNLHAGKAPEYRGAAPAFWEMFHGESEVGVTIHQVEASLDSGLIYAQECFPLDDAPAGDPMDYIESYRQSVLQPNGLRMLAQTVFDIVDGRAAGTPQDASSARTFRSPTHRQVKELRKRVAARRSERVARR